MSAARLEKTFGTRARVLRSLTLVPVREQEHERGLQSPLRAARGDELVDDHLRAVDEVAVLRFPDHEAIGFLDVVAELESDDAGFAERAVVDLERGARLRERLERDERLAGLRVVEHRVTLAERAALDVFSGQPDRDAVGQDAGKGELLGRGPVDRSLGRVVQHRLAALAGAFQLLVEHESSRRRLQSFVDLPQPLERDGGLCARRGARRGGLRHRRLEILLGLQRRERLLEHGVVLLDQPLDRLGRLRALRDRAFARIARAPSGAWRSSCTSAAA